MQNKFFKSKMIKPLSIVFYLLITETLVNRCKLNFGITAHRATRQLDMSYGSSTYKFCECGRKNRALVGDIRIVGGLESMENEYPWVALIMAKDRNLICGGSLINDRYVVTAAHCLSLGYEQRELKVVLGEHDICQEDTQTVKFSIERLIVHPRYDNRTEYADIMLLRLNMKVTFNKFIRPICLPQIESRMTTWKKFGGKFVTALGWGLADVPHQVCTLRSVNLEIFRSEYCQGEVSTAICAGLNAGGRDACLGDSGGPLQIINAHERYELIGITSTGIGCGNGYPGVYTDVVSMVSWIIKITTRDSMYCWR